MAWWKKVVGSLAQRAPETHSMLKRALAATVMMWPLLVGTSRADLHSCKERSLEWLVDSSDAIVVGSTILKDHKGLHVGHATHRRWRSDKVYFLRAVRLDLATFYSIEFDTARKAQCRDGEWRAFLAVDKQGVIVSDRNELVRRIDQRVRHGSSIPVGCDREAVERGESCRGGFGIHGNSFEIWEERGQPLDFLVELLVPADEEFGEEARVALSLPDDEAKSRPPFFGDRELMGTILRENYSEGRASPENGRGED